MRAEENSEDKTDNLDQSNKVAQLKAEKKVSSNIEGKFTGNIICKEGFYGQFYFRFIYLFVNV